MSVEIMPDAIRARWVIVASQGRRSWTWRGANVQLALRERHHDAVLMQRALDRKVDLVPHAQ